MGWSIGYDSDWDRDIGYGVPATCDYPGCPVEINRGLGHVCGGEPYGGECGCGLYFCGKHLFSTAEGQECERCLEGQAPFSPAPEHPQWIHHKLTATSWEEWRHENPEWVEASRTLLMSLGRSLEPTPDPELPPGAFLTKIPGKSGIVKIPILKPVVSPTKVSDDEEVAMEEIPLRHFQMWNTKTNALEAEWWMDEDDNQWVKTPKEIPNDKPDRT